MFSPTKWLMLPVIGLAFLFGSSTDLLIGWLPLTNGLLRGLVAIFVAWIGMMVISAIVSKMRASRFIRRDAPRLVQLVKDAQKNAPAESQVSTR